MSLCHSVSVRNNSKTMPRFFPSYKNILSTFAAIIIPPYSLRYFLLAASTISPIPTTTDITTFRPIVTVPFTILQNLTSFIRSTSHFLLKNTKILTTTTIASRTTDDTCLNNLPIGILLSVCVQGDNV